MTDLQKISKRILRAIETGEVDGNDPFVVNAGILAEMVWEKEEESQKAFDRLTNAEVIRLHDLINDEKLKKEGKA
jgi:diacylglycerol kinase family enzyme